MKKTLLLIAIAALFAVSGCKKDGEEITPLEEMMERQDPSLGGVTSYSSRQTAYVFSTGSSDFATLICNGYNNRASSIDDEQVKAMVKAEAIKDKKAAKLGKSIKKKGVIQTGINEATDLAEDLKKISSDTYDKAKDKVEEVVKDFENSPDGKWLKKNLKKLKKDLKARKKQLQADFKE